MQERNRPSVLAMRPSRSRELHRASAVAMCPTRSWELRRASAVGMSPAAVKREVFARDAGCCGYVDARGERCGERRYLELHHLTPFAQGGEHVASNLALRCAAHNALAAEEDFGRSVVERHRTAAAHESFCAQERREVARLERGD